MAGKVCPNCEQMTFHKTPKGRKCSQCEYEMVVPPNGGKGGKGQECPNCGKHTVRAVAGQDNRWQCNGCGATFTLPRN